MANPISDKIQTGTIGELLVQLRLLQYGIQAQPPLKDSGNDLIGVKGRTVKFIQVKTTKKDRFPDYPNQNSIYDLLFIVRLKGHDDQILLDQSEIYILTKDQTKCVERNWNSLNAHKLSRDNCGFS